MNSIVGSKLDLYKPGKTLTADEINSLLKKWEIPKYEIQQNSKIKDIIENNKKGFYIDPYQLIDWIGEDHKRLEIVYANEDLFIRLLKAHTYDPTVNNNYAIRRACFYGHLTVVELLLQNEKVDPTAQDNEAIKVASQNGHSKVVEALLKDGRADPTADHNSAIRWASFKGHSKVVKALLQNEKVDPSAKNNTAIKRASYYGRSELVKVLLANKKLRLEAKDISDIRKKWSADHEIMDLLRDYELGLGPHESKKNAKRKYPF